MSEENKCDIVLCGVGGQGIVMLSNGLGQACAREGVKVLTGELHGLSQRSGTVYIHSRMGGTDLSPIIPYGEADVILAMEAMEALRYIEYLKKDGIIILNSRMMHPPLEVAELSKKKSTDFIKFESIIEKLQVVTKNIAQIDALGLAKEAGNILTENSVLIGTLAALADIPPSVGNMKAALAAVVPKKALEQNEKAFDLGHKEAYKSLCDHVACRE